mgnify:CR=1 FL=1
MSPVSEARVAATGRWSREDWVELAVARLKAAGASALTLESLCVAAGRTKGSFYHHFGTVEDVLVELARRWRRTETDEIGAVAAAEADPRKGPPFRADGSQPGDRRPQPGRRSA